MAKDLNSVALMGRLARDPELRYTKNNKAVCSITLAVNTGWGENEETSWIDATAWGASAEALSNYCTKGSKIVIEGSLRTSNYEKQDGTKLKSTNVNIQSFYFAENKNTNAQPVKTKSQNTANKIPAASIPYESFEYDSDDVPF